MITGWLKRIGEILIPTRCQLCQQPDDNQICCNCSSLITPVGEQRCIRCGRRRSTSFASPDCQECYGASIGVARARSIFVYNESGRSALAQFKFSGKPGVGLRLIELAEPHHRGDFPGFYAEPDFDASLTMPVPLHRNRLRRRRFNQSELIARRIAETINARCLPDALKRIRDTPSQVGLTANQRLLNVRGAFAVSDAAVELLKHRDVVLVDDLMTTGATLAACARALKKAGAGQVYGFTLFSTTRNESNPNNTVSTEQHDSQMR